MGGFNQAKKCHHLKPFGIADFTGTAVLQAACGSRLQLHPLRLAAPPTSTIAQYRYKKCVWKRLLVFFTSGLR